MPASSVAERRRGDEDLRDWWQYLVHERDRPIETRRRSLERQHNAFLIGVDLAKARPDVEVNTPYDPDAWRMDLEQDHSPDHGHPTLLSLSLHETVPSSSSPTYDTRGSPSPQQRLGSWPPNCRTSSTSTCVGTTAMI